MPEPVVDVRRLTKSYGDFVAVRNLSFAVYPGEIFGLLGPNGAGKTTTIRILMDIYAADQGQVQVLGQHPSRVRSRVGYLPEERGLYRNLKVMEVLVYLAALKGVPRSQARRHAEHWLARVELDGWAERKVKDLSRGMQQQLQFVASLVHDPELLVLDEPFQGLDPVNVERIKAILQELQAAGKTIMLSTHQMNLVEELCDRIVLIHRGTAVLYGDLDEIQRRHAPRRVRIRTTASLPDLPGVAQVERRGDTYLVELADGTPQDLLRALVLQDVPILGFEVARVPLNEIFVAVVQGEMPGTAGMPQTETQEARP